MGAILTARALRKTDLSARGRYNVKNVSEPRGGLSPAAVNNSRTALIAVEDPENPKLRHLARVNTQTDVLELEYSAKPQRITLEQYLVGRLLQEVFERGSGTPGKSSIEPGDRGDPSEARLALMVKKLDDAALCVAIEERMKKDVGTIGYKSLRRILGGESLASMAGALASERAISFQGGLFRHYLARLAELPYWRASIGFA
jgi:hypothetical protein